MRKYTDEQVEFIREMYPGRSGALLAALFNERFGTDVPAKTLISYAYYCEVKNGRIQYRKGPARKYTDEQLEFIHKMYPGRSGVELTVLFNERFGTDFTVRRLTSVAYNHGIKNGRTTRFSKGYEPTQFKPGRLRGIRG